MNPPYTSKSSLHNAARPASHAASPHVSIIITAFNADAYLTEAVESIFAQHGAVTWEILLVDDGSTDRTFVVAKELARASPYPMKVLQHPGGINCGISASRNLALRYARAPITAFLDADDIWLPDRLLGPVALLSSHPAVAMVYAQAERWHDFHLPYDPAIGSLGQNFTPPLLPQGQAAGVLPPPSLLAWFLQDESMTPCTCTVLVRTAIARRIGGFEHSFTGIYDDQVFYAKLALAYPILVSEQVVARYRQHPASCCATARRDNLGDHGRKLFLHWLEDYRAALTSTPLPPEFAPQLDSQVSALAGSAP